MSGIKVRSRRFDRKPASTKTSKVAAGVTLAALAAAGAGMLAYEHSKSTTTG